jgi:hypothetical protein
MTDRPPVPKLRIPEPRAAGAAGAGAFDPSPAAVGAWMRTLPLANVGETSRRLLEALHGFNRTRAEAGVRLAALERLAEPLTLADRALDRRVVGHTFPLSAKQRRIAELGRTLHLEMATGYKIVVVDLLRAPRPDRHRLAVAIRRAQDHLTAAILKSCLVYAPAPAGCWHELHLLYRVAEEHRVDGLAIAAGGDRDGGSVVDGYRRALLIGASCLYRLPQGEQSRLAALFAQWAPALDLTPLPDGAGATSELLVVDLDADAPPGYLRYLRPSAPESCRVLGTAALMTRLQRILAEADAAEAAHPLRRGDRPDVATLRRLAPIWGLVAHRAFRRNERSGEALVTIGLHAIHHTLCRAAGSVPGCAQVSEGGLADPRARFTSRNLPRHDGDAPDVWDMVYERIDTRRGPAAVTVQLNPSAAELDRSAHEWHMRNLSADGCCLLWASEGAGAVQIGELVGIRQGPPDTVTWHLGVIRRMLAGTPEGLEIGVQLIAPRGVPAAVRRTPGTDSRSVHRRALHLPGIEALQQAPSLIVEPCTYRSGDTLVLVTGEAEQSIRLTHRLEDTGLFAQFRFEPAERTGVPDPESDGPDAFDELWRTL